MHGLCSAPHAMLSKGGRKGLGAKQHCVCLLKAGSYAKVFVSQLRHSDFTPKGGTAEWLASVDRARCTPALGGLRSYLFR